ncbi:hypothetical protein AB0F91_38910 [Amycolatopsis sp. NPDC023774]|uniref:hypothetical protein n=1 Tax=Amycolatopsis sp. NPDC023774 TaxID=3155015 RepID=UPI0033C57D42
MPPSIVFTTGATPRTAFASGAPGTFTAKAAPQLAVLRSTAEFTGPLVIRPSSRLWMTLDVGSSSCRVIISSRPSVRRVAEDSL